MESQVPHICDQDGVKINLMGPEVPREKNTLSEIPFWASWFYSDIKYPFLKFGTWQGKTLFLQVMVNTKNKFVLY